jgi:hypothetical protein
MVALARSRLCHLLVEAALAGRVGVPLLAFVLVSGCDGDPKIEWVNSPVQDIPPYFSSRNALLDRSGIYRHKLAELPGKVLYKEPADSTYTFKSLLLKPGYRPTIETIPEDAGKVFDGIINRQVAADVSYIALSTSLSDKSLVEVHIKDRVLSFIANSDVPWSLLAAESRRPKPRGTTERYWVQGVMMASLDYTTATEVDLKAGGKLTEAFGANGKVYNKTDKATHDYRISMELINLDDLSTLTEVSRDIGTLKFAPGKLGPLVGKLRPPKTVDILIRPETFTPPR